MASSGGGADPRAFMQGSPAPSVPIAGQGSPPPAGLTGAGAGELDSRRQQLAGLMQSAGGGRFGAARSGFGDGGQFGAARSSDGGGQFGAARESAGGGFGGSSFRSGASYGRPSTFNSFRPPGS